LDYKTGVETKIIKNYDPRNKKNMFYYRVQCMPIVALFQFGFNCGKLSEFKKVPWFIFNAESSLRKSFVEGYLKGDGNSSIDKRYKTHFRRFSTKSKELAEGLCFVLKTLNHGKNHFKKDIKHIAWQYRKDKPKIQTLRLQSAKETKKGFCLAEIKSIERIPGEENVYDIEVRGSHNLVDAEGMILVHNTDSIFMEMGKKRKKEVLEFLEKENRELPSLMELELEDFYPRGIFVMRKDDKGGAKKKYALMAEDGKIKVRGFETVRRDWSLVAKETQKKVLKIVLEENNIEKAYKYVRNVIEDIKNKKIDKEKMIIQTQLKKNLDNYELEGPHVYVAKKMKAKGILVSAGTIINYIVKPGSGLIRARADIPEDAKDYDSEYYINKQVIPAVERIFNALGYDASELIEGKKQKKLGDF